MSRASLRLRMTGVVFTICEEQDEIVSKIPIAQSCG
jgi:hypothetical protein